MRNRKQQHEGKEGKLDMFAANTVRARKLSWNILYYATHTHVRDLYVFSEPTVAAQRIQNPKTDSTPAFTNENSPVASQQTRKFLEIILPNPRKW